jgi:hypothetical protein
MYKQAQQDESLRQAFLDRFLQKNPNENVEALTYNLHQKPGLDRITELEFSGLIDGEEANLLRKMTYESTPYAFLLITPEMIGKGDKHTILVNSKAFDELNETDLEYNLIDHEYIHTHDFRYGIPFSNGKVINHTNASQLQPNTLEAVLDTRALMYQLIKGREKGIQDSNGFMNAINGFMKYYFMLKDIKPQNDFEKEIIRIQVAIINKYFPNI